MNKITEQDLANRGVKGLPDVPGLTTEEMQRKLEEIAREILIPKVNELVEGLNNANSNLNNKKLISVPFTVSDVYTVPDGYSIENPNAICGTYRGIANAYYNATYGKFSLTVFNVDSSTATIDGVIYFWIVK